MLSHDILAHLLAQLTQQQLANLVTTTLPPPLPLPLAFETCSIAACHREAFLDTLIDASKVRNGRIDGFC